MTDEKNGKSGSKRDTRHELLPQSQGVGTLGIRGKEKKISGIFRFFAKNLG